MTGRTAIANGEELLKNDEKIHLLGTLDELNSYIGLVKVKITDDNDKINLETIQKNIVKIMTHISDSKNEDYFFNVKNLADLEIETEKLIAFLPEKPDFVLPGKTETEAQIHIARTIARRAERYYVAVDKNKYLCQFAGEYLNKLSDYLFSLSFKYA